MVCALHSFYGHAVIDQDLHFPVFIREQAGYYLAFIYLSDEDQFSREYQKEGIFFRNLQMPPIYAYAKRVSNALLEQEQQAEELKEENIEPEDSLDKDQEKAASLALKKFVLSGTEKCADGSSVQLWKDEEGRIVKIYPDHIFKNMGNER